MQHVDEGMIHAFLDGELSPAEATEFERHLSVCAPCRAKFAEEQGFVTEAAGLVVALDDVPPGTRPATTPIPLRRARPWFVRPATLAWAASIVAAAGVGYAWRGAPATPEFAEAPVASVVAKGTDRADAAPAPVEVPATAAPAARQAATAERRAAPSAPPPEPTVVAAEPTALADASPAAAGAGAAAGRANAAAELSRDSASPAPAAAQALAATAQYESARGYVYERGVPVDTGASSQRLAFGPATIAEPRRITMDEAVSLLGGSIQLIDGLTPQRVEVIAGIDVAGADPNRQVVRIYYEEPDLGLVTLDQQRPGPSFEAMRRAEEQTPSVTVLPSAPARSRSAMAGPQSTTTIWRTDGVWLALTSRLPADRMAALQARVK